MEIIEQHYHLNGQWKEFDIKYLNKIRWLCYLGKLGYSIKYKTVTGIIITEIHWNNRELEIFLDNYSFKICDFIENIPEGYIDMRHKFWPIEIKD